MVARTALLVVVAAAFFPGASAAAIVAKRQQRPKPSADLVLATGSRERFRAVASSSFVKPIEYRHSLRVCNAYPNRAAFDIFLGAHGGKLTQSPLQYKHCLDFEQTIKDGDKLEFRLGEINAGSFQVSDLPSNDAVLMLVVYRHDAVSTSVAFESHVFANLINAQIAVLDTFKGNTKATMRIQDGMDAKTSRNEELRFDSVVAVNPGLYDVVAQNAAGAAKIRQELVALNRESYVVIRTGVEAEDGESWPEELMVYPRSDPKVLTGSALSLCGRLPLLLTALWAALAGA